MVPRARIRMAVFVAVVTLPLSIVLLPTRFAQADSGWYAQSSPTTASLTGVDFVGPDQGWICGGGGVILHTTDGGAHWTSQQSGTQLDLTDISFADSQTGFAVGDMKIMLRTFDGGTTWQTISPPQQDYPFSAVRALDTQHVWSAGATMEEPFFNGFVRWSANQGSDWVGYGVPCPRNPPHYYCSSEVTALSVVNLQVAFIWGYRQWYDFSQEGALFRTTNGGANWTELSAQGWISHGFQFLDAAVGYAAVGGVAKTTDGGLTWVSHPSGIAASHLSFVDATYGWAVGSGGGICVTRDGGTTWVQQASGTTEDLSRVDFVNSLVGAVVGAHGTILHTVTGGNDVVGIPGPAPSASYRLLTPAPNPSGHDVFIAYELPGFSQVSLGVFDASGRLLRTLEAGPRPAGHHGIYWDGTDASGVAVASGVYFIRLNSAGSGNRQQVTILR
jgi:photosystem II stability/assembly factor-like uncharacterized protein